MILLPTIPDLETVRKHYREIAEGKRTDHVGYGKRRLSGTQKRHGYTFVSSRKQPIVQLVTPIAMAAEQARAKLVKSAKTAPLKKKKTGRVVKKRSTIRRKTKKPRDRDRS